MAQASQEWRAARSRPAAAAGATEEVGPGRTSLTRRRYRGAARPGPAPIRSSPAQISGGCPARVIRHTVRQLIGRRRPAGSVMPEPVAAEGLGPRLAAPQARSADQHPAQDVGQPDRQRQVAPGQPHPVAGLEAVELGVPGRLDRRVVHLDLPVVADVPAPVPHPPGQLDPLVGVPEPGRPAAGVVERRRAAGPPRPPTPTWPGCCGPGRPPAPGGSSGAAPAARPDRPPAAGSARAGGRRRTRPPSGRARPRWAGRRRRPGRTAGRRPPGGRRRCGRRGCPGSPAGRGRGRRRAARWAASRCRPPRCRAAPPAGRAARSARAAGRRADRPGSAPPPRTAAGQPPAITAASARRAPRPDGRPG